jgi:protein TonB
MFERATLDPGPASKRIWTTCMGITGEALLVGCTLIAPMIWPQALPRAGALITRLSAPGSPAPPPKVQAAPRAPIPAVPPSQIRKDALILPRVIPAKPAIIDDPPLEAPPSFTVAGGTGLPGANGPGGALLDDVLRHGAAAAPPPVHVDRPPAPKPAAQAIRRLREGGLVKLARPISQPQPQYPRIALLARISGEVKLEAVIGIDGRIRDVRIVSGHPLLAPAAVDAVRRWLYEPTTLNGDPVEVIAPIVVTFRLN